MKTLIALLTALLTAMAAWGQLQGVIDIHVHSAPDSVARSIDAIDLARLAKSRGMRGLVLKNHWESTASLAYIARKEVPGIEIFGGIDLNRAVGGLNPAAIERMVLITGGWGRVIWMPTFDAENYVHFRKQNVPFASVSRNGQLLPETIEVLKLIASNKLVLGTGHSSAAEDLMLVREGKRQGIAQIIVTHPMDAPIHMSIPEMQEAARMGAYLELCGNALLPTQPQDGQIPVAEYIKTIRAVGPEHLILSGDVGQAVNPPYPEAWKQFLETLRKAGVSSAEIDLMAKKNPATLLGLD